MKKLILISILALPFTIHANTTVPPIPNGNGNPTATLINNPNFNTENLNPNQVMKVLDPQEGLGANTDEGTFSWKGRTFDVGTSRVFRSRFERYLNQSERNIVDHEQYQELLSQVLDLLSPRHLSGSETVFSDNVDKAYRILYEASNHPQDGGTSRVLAHMIYNSWRMRDEIRQTIANMTEEERRIAAQESIVSNRSRMADRRAYDDAQRLKREEVDAYNALRGSDAHDGDVSLEQGRLQVQRGRLELSGTQLQVQTQLAQFQFQSQIIYFLMQRRFEHAIMASYFYRALFRGSAQQVQVGEQFLSQFFPQGDMVYTVEALEQIAQEAINDTRNSMESVNNSLEQGDLFAAMERLQESFYLGEHLKYVSTFPRNDRQDILTVYRKMREARELLTLRDYDKLIEISTELLHMSNDSKFNEVNSYARNAMQMANLKLAQAKLLMSQNNFPDAQKALQESAEIWPLNPELTNFSTNISNQTNASFVAVQKFDRAVRDSDYRSIFTDRHELGLGLATDPERGPLLQQIIDKVAETDMLLTQARHMVNNNNPNAAWEFVIQAEEILPRDYNVFTLKSELLPHTSQFSKYLSKARELENQGNYVLSYAWYERAKSVYPASIIANNAQSRITPLLTAQINSL